ncbi:hypothetical protein V4F39_20375 [Aquincola sp. MAHUQ-54]|uniref:Uncharacterized protein n=1 Tax=Aquincola agrisoli TaxID=3119538 RepID=A0AAW9QHG2_9BURK
MDPQTRWWWTFLCGIAALNVAAWAASALWLHRRGAARRADVRLHLLLSAVYVAGCAWRSVLPVFDIQRQVLVDSALSSVLVGRSVATLAELCFAAQWALLLAASARSVQAHRALWTARVIVPMIAIAELFSWHAVLTTSNLGHVVEEALWGTAAALAALTMASIAPRHAGRARVALYAAATAGAAYVAYMFAIDVPMYWARWLADEAAGRSYLALADGLADAASRWTVSHRWSDWHTEVVWMSLYFSVAVWISIALAHLRWPRPLQAAGARA